MKNYYKIQTVNQGWRKIPHAIFYDENLTSDAKVILSELLAVSGEFHISESGIANSVHISLDRVKKAIRLLKSQGYIQIIHIKEGSRFNGCEWGISDTSGTFHQTENPTSGNQASGFQTNENPENNDEISIRRKTQRVETPQTENPTNIYQYTERYQRQNIKEEENQRRESKTEEREIPLTPTPLNQSGESVISPERLNTIQAFNRFCEVYPKVGDIDQARAAFLAIPDIDKICYQIANSVEWFEKSGRWNDWQTGQKNVSCPQAVKFLTRGDWKEYLKSGATMSEEERLMSILHKSRQNVSFGGTDNATN